MLATTGFVMIVLVLAAVLSKRISILLALTIIPIVATLVLGQGGKLGEYISDGVTKVSPVAILLIFAVLYFSLMVDSGLFDPVVNVVLRWAKNDPVKVTVGTAVITLLVALDGDGSSTFLITITALLPVYRRLGMRPLVLACIVGLAAGMMNIIPWGGPTARAMAVLHMDSSDLFVPLLPVMGVGALWIVLVAFLLGRTERARLKVEGVQPIGSRVSVGAESRDTGVATARAGAPTATRGDAPAGDDSGGPHGGGDSAVDGEPAPAPRRPGRADRVRQWCNLVLTALLVAGLITEVAPLLVLFMVAFVIALVINRPTWDQQQDLFRRHGFSVVLVSLMTLAAGILTGVMTGTGMIEAMARSLVELIPTGAGGFLPVVVAITSMPLSLVFTPDAYYFAIVPILAETAAAYGTDPAEIGRAALLGHMTTGFPLSPLVGATFVLIGLTGVTLGEHQRFSFKWAFGTTVVMTLAALALGVISL